MASPRTMFSGSIELGLMNIPITIGKATGEGREPSLVDVAVQADGSMHQILRNEHIANGEEIYSKAKAVKLASGDYRLFDDRELLAIENSTKTPTLQVLDCQPLSKLPMVYSLGIYYIRHDPKSKVSAKAFAALTERLTASKRGLIAKWGNSSRQKLVVISADGGILNLRVLPFVSDIRAASDLEREHWSAKVSDQERAKMDELLTEIQHEEFDYASYSDEGLRLRSEAVDRILVGEAPENPPENMQSDEGADPFAMIDKAIEAYKVKA